MIRDHLIATDFLSGQVHVHVAGAGGTGSRMINGLAQLNASLRALGHEGLDVMLYDPDTVSEANLGRQLFSAADVGMNKAIVMINRMNAWYGTRWVASPHKFDIDHQTKRSMVITCVDSAKARIEIGKDIAREYHKATYWLDLGNRAADGQMVLGVPAWDAEHAAMEYRLPTVLELFPQMITDAKTLDKESGPSCSLADALEKQELFINQLVAVQALQLLWQLFRRGKTNWHGAFINATSGRVTPLPVDPRAWARMGYVRPAAPSQKKKAR